jgi:hypothetical protein
MSSASKGMLNHIREKIMAATARQDPKIVVGWREWLALLEFAIPAIKAARIRTLGKRYAP